MNAQTTRMVLVEWNIGFLRNLGIPLSDIRSMIINKVLNIGPNPQFCAHLWPKIAFFTKD